MTERSPLTFTAFLGEDIIARGTVEEVVTAAKTALDEGTTDRVAIFDDAECRVFDFDFRGTPQDVLERLKDHPLLPGTAPEVRPRSGPGRPRLGVVAREVTLLPRHWEWLGEQRGGASATLRRLVDGARRRDAPREEARRARDAAYRFMSDMAADLPGFEEASRCLFSGSYPELERAIRHWPRDIREHAQRLVGRLKELEERGEERS